MHYIIQVFDEFNQTFRNYDDYEDKGEAMRQVRSMSRTCDENKRIRVVRRKKEVRTVLSPTRLRKIDEKI